MISGAKCDPSGTTCLPYPTLDGRGKGRAPLRRRERAGIGDGTSAQLSVQPDGQKQQQGSPHFPRSVSVPRLNCRDPSAEQLQIRNLNFRVRTSLLFDRLALTGLGARHLLPANIVCGSVSRLSLNYVRRGQPSDKCCQGNCTTVVILCHNIEFLSYQQCSKHKVQPNCGLLNVST